jgi:hypothetical protein
VERFHQDADREQKRAALKKENSWQRDVFITKQGWATMPEDGKSSHRIVQECASRILTVTSS